MASNQLRHFRIFLASPGDVAAERSLVMKVVDDLQYDPSLRDKVTLKVIAWEKKGAPPLEAGIPPQEAIRQGLTQPSECDIVVVIFWSRMGTPTQVNGIEYQSGTYYEYEDAMRSYARSGSPRILVYRRTEKVEVDLDDPDLVLKREQRRLVTQFFDQFNDPKTKVASGGYNTYQKPEEFREQFDGHLRNLISRLLETSSEPSSLDHQPIETPKLWQGSPFPGLRAFNLEDAPIFFGRGRETDALVRRVQEHSFVAVVGASGSGKSSLVRAGLIPRLLDTSAVGTWIIATFTPDRLGAGNPFASLAAALMNGSLNRDESQLARRLRETPELLAEICEQVLKNQPPEAKLLLFIDQFEELFTTIEPIYRSSFINLLSLVTKHERICIVVTLRGDFYAQAIGLEELAMLLEAGTIPLSTPGIGSLYEMITRPAVRAGLVFEDGLVERILNDTGTDPGALALMAFTLDELYRACKETGQLTHKVYEQLGGVQGAIGERSEQIFANLDKAAKSALMRVFRELIRVEADGTATRQRVPLSHFADDPNAIELINTFTQARLLLRGGSIHDEPFVEVAHEALFRSWKRLSDWIDEYQDDLKLLQRVRQAAYEWHINGRPDHFLWKHERLEPVYQMQKRLHAELSSIEAAFVLPEASRLIKNLAKTTLPQHTRLTIIDRFVEIGKPALRPLERALKHRKPQVRYCAAEALGRIGDRRAVPSLIEALNNERDEAVRQLIIESLGQLRDRRAVDVLIQATRHFNFRVRHKAILALRRIGDRRAIPAFKQAVSATELSMIISAIKSLGELGGDNEVTFLISHLDNITSEETEKNKAIRKALIRAIGSIGNEKAIPILNAALSDDDQYISKFASEALEKIQLRIASKNKK